MVLPLSAGFGLSDLNTGRAYADVPIVPPVYAGVPNSLASAAAVAEAEGVVTAAGAATTAGALGVSGELGVGAICTGALPVCAGVGLIAGGAYLAWKWKQGHNFQTYDQPTLAFYGNYGVGGSCTGSSCSYNLANNGNTSVDFGPYATYAEAAGRAGPNITVPAHGTANVTQSYSTSGNPIIGVCFSVSSTHWDASLLNPGTTGCRNFFGGTGPGPSASSTQAGTNPTMTTTPTSTCTNGTSTQTVTGGSVTYHANDTSLPVLTVPPCPAGYLRSTLTTPTTANGATVAPPMTWTAPTISAQYPNCQPGGSAAPCVMTLVKVSPSGQRTNCTGNTACAGWNPAGEPDGSTYECKFGPYVVATTECKTVPTEGAPASSSTATDVKTGVANAGTGTGTSTNTNDSNCLGGWSWNPVDWVEKPVKCALHYAWDNVVAPAVTPSEQTKTRFANLRATVAGKAPFGYMSQISGFVTGLAPNGCEEGPTIHANLSGSGSGYQFKPANLCTGDLHDALHPLRTVLGIVLWGGVVLAFGMWLFRASVPVVGGGEGA